MTLVAGAQQRLGDIEVALVVAGQAPGGALGGQPLELGPHQIDVAALLGAEQAHDGAAMAELVDQADRLQLAQRLPHRRAADAEAGCQVLLAQPRAEGNAAGDDLDLELVGEVVGARQRGVFGVTPSILTPLDAQVPHRVYPFACSSDPNWLG